METTGALAGMLRRIAQWTLSRLRAAADFLFGYDFFISYAHRDGTQYPRLLRDRLETLGYRTFLDVHGYTGGDDLRAGTRRRIGMSKRLILLARPHALSSSRWVELELQHFIALNRSPIVIEFPVGAALAPDGSPLAELLRERRSIREDADLDGAPSEGTIQELVRSFDATRQETVRLRALGATAALFVIIAIAAIWQWYTAVQERRVAEAQRGDARATSKFAEASRLMAEWDIEATRRARLLTEIGQLNSAATADQPAPPVRIGNLNSELAETDKTMSQRTTQAEAARRAGHEELIRATAAWQQVARATQSIRQKPPVPRIFSLESLSVGFGESLILHYGDPDAPRFILIDGGQPLTYERSLKPRLEALRKRWRPNGQLPIEYVMVSNQDNDRLGGLERMLRELRTLQDQGAQSPLDIRNLWYESFVPPYSFSKALTRQHADQLGIPVNKPFDHLVMRRETGRLTIDLGGCLTATILGPDKSALDKLHRLWAREAEERRMTPPAMPAELFRAIPALPPECQDAPVPVPVTNAELQPARQSSCRDQSVVNRASLIILFEFAGKRFLHPGDSCSDQVEAGLRAAGLSGPDGSFDVDVMLVPHLGSAMNVNVDFFQRVKARQYLFTGSGRFRNPSDETLRMILGARRTDAGSPDKYVLQFLNREGTDQLGERLDRFFASSSSDEFGYRRIFRATAENAIIIDLLEQVRY